MIEIALYQPDIAANTGAIARICACFGLPLTIIEPAGFPWNDSSFKRAGMDYADLVTVRRAASWSAFQKENSNRRIILLSTKGASNYLDFSFKSGDILLLGRESSGVPEDVHNSIAHRLFIAMKPPARSLNVGVTTGIVAAEAIRQLRQ